MKKVRHLLFITVLMLSLTITAGAEGKIYANKNANLRTGPGIDYNDYTSVKAGTAMHYTGKKVKDDRGVYWYKITYKKKTLYISSKVSSQVSKPSTTAKNKVTTTADVNLRKGPGKKYKSYIVVQKGTTLKYLGKTKKDNRKVKWYKVSYYGKSLWVSSRYAVRGSVKSAKLVTTGDVNLRYGASLDSGVYGSVKKGTVLTYLNQSNTDDRGIKWYKVSYKSKKLWVSSAYTKFK